MQTRWFGGAGQHRFEEQWHEVRDAPLQAVTGRDLEHPVAEDIELAARRNVDAVRLEVEVGFRPDNEVLRHQGERTVPRRWHEKRGMVASGAENKGAGAEVVDPVPQRCIHVAVPLHLEHRVQSVQHLGGIPEFGIGQCLLAQGVDHGHGVHGRCGAVTADID